MSENQFFADDGKVLACAFFPGFPHRQITLGRELPNCSRYTITHAIEDANVLRFHVDYFKPEGNNVPRQGETLAKKAIVEAILAKHDAATGGRRFNALLATASINDAIEYHRLFTETQAEKKAADPDFQPLNIACVFSPPAEGDKDVQQIQEDLPQEKQDNEVEPEKKKAALKAILADYNRW